MQTYEMIPKVACVLSFIMQHEKYNHLTWKLTTPYLLNYFYTV